MDTPIIDALLEMRRGLIRHGVSVAGLKVEMGRDAGKALENELVQTGSLGAVRINPSIGERSVEIAGTLVRWPA